MRPTFPVLITVIFALAALQTDVFGQGTFSNGSGTFGSNSIGSGSSGFGSSGSSSSRSSSSRSSTSGSSSSRSSLSGLSSGGGSAIGNLGGNELNMESLSNSNTLFAPDQFRVGNRQSGQFVGTSLFDPRTFIGATTAGSSTAGSSTTGRTGLSIANRARSTTSGSTMGFTGRTGSTGLRTGRGGSSSSTGIRAAVRVGFALPPTPSADLSASLTQRLAGSPQLQTRLPVEVSVENRVATLRGAVATPYDRIVAQRLIQLEPGIQQVRNELVVAQTPPASVAGSPPAAAP